MSSLQLPLAIIVWAVAIIVLGMSALFVFACIVATIKSVKKRGGGDKRV